MFSLINPTRLRTQPQLDLDGERLQPTEAEVVLADQYRGDPTSSSLAVASDVVLFKPRPDLLLLRSTGVVSFRV